ncbi:hypothetical protein [Methylobacterium nodulans]|uniref:hypothetical protein n=1 Tax=Methylobacterium nodulans TaxID=114616 RepID=UPI0005C23D7E|nr:hypothetical protein [Methylobacterium nodulans]
MVERANADARHQALLKFGQTLRQGRAAALTLSLKLRQQVLLLVCRSGPPLQALTFNFDLGFDVG